MSRSASFFVEKMNGFRPISGGGYFIAGLFKHLTENSPQLTVIVHDKYPPRHFVYPLSLSGERCSLAQFLNSLKQLRPVSP